VVEGTLGKRFWPQSPPRLVGAGRRLDDSFLGVSADAMRDFPAVRLANGRTFELDVITTILREYPGTHAYPDVIHGQRLDCLTSRAQFPPPLTFGPHTVPL